MSVTPPTGIHKNSDEMLPADADPDFTPDSWTNTESRQTIGQKKLCSEKSNQPN